MKDVPNYSEACQVLQKNLSYRAKRLQNLQRYVEGTQYEGLPDWFSETKPLWERAPCIVYPIVRSAIDSNSDLLLGEGRFPLVAVEGLEGEEAESFEKAVARVMQHARFPAACRDVFAGGQGVSSSCAVFGIKGGRLFIETVLAKWCEPILKSDGSVVSLEIRYPYLATIKVGGEEKCICKIYRRVIDATSDITYNPAEAREDGAEPNWTISEEVHHGLGFCPVVWYPHMRGCQIHTDFDGKAIHEHLTDEIRAHDFALSQRHRAALYAGDPQWTECGVTPGHNPTGTARKAEVPASTFGRPGEVAHASYVSGRGTSKARKKSPGTVWQYESSETKVQLHVLPGDALKVLDDHARDLRAKIAESLGVVFIDMDNMPNESRLSGHGLEVLKARQLDRVENYRSDFGDKFFLPGLGMLLRIAIDRGLKIEGLDVVERVVERSSNWSWHVPSIDLMWGSFYRASGEEEELVIRALVQAKTAGLTTTRACVEKLRGILDIKDIDAFMAELTQETEERKKQEEDAAMKAAEHAASLKPAPAPKADVNA